MRHNEKRKKVRKGQVISAVSIMAASYCRTFWKDMWSSWGKWTHSWTWCYLPLGRSTPSPGSTWNCPQPSAQYFKHVSLVPWKRKKRTGQGYQRTDNLCKAKMSGKQSNEKQNNKSLCNTCNSFWDLRLKLTHFLSLLTTTSSSFSPSWPSHTLQEEINLSQTACPISPRLESVLC